MILWADGSSSTVGVTLGASYERRIFPSQFGHPGHYGAALTLLIPFALVGVQGARRKAAAAAYSLAAAAGTLALILTYARAAWIAFAVSALFALSSWRARAFALVGAVVLAAPFSAKIVDRVVNGDYGNEARTGIWAQALSIIREHPLTGVGVRNFPFHAGPIDTTQLAAQPPHAHNLLLNTAAELGVPAAAALAGLLILILAGLRLARGASDDAADLLLVRGCLAAVVALLVAGTLDVAAYQRYTLPLTACVLGLACALGLSAVRAPRPGAPGALPVDASGSRPRGRDASHGSAGPTQVGRTAD